MRSSPDEETPGPEGRRAPRRRSRDVSRWLSPLVMLALAGTVVALMVQKRALRLEAVELRQQVTWPTVGMALPAFQATSLDGARITVGRSDRAARQVLFILDTRCGNCLVTLPAWDRVTQALEAHPGRAEVIGIATNQEDEARAYVREHGLAFPVISRPDERFRRLYKVAGVPITLVADEEGFVADVVLGSIFREVEVLTDSIIDAALARIE